MSPYAPWYLIVWRLFWWPLFVVGLLTLALALTLQYGWEPGGRRVIREIGLGL